MVVNETISKVLRERIAAGDFPSAVYLVAEQGKIMFTDPLGNAVIEPERIPATIETIYDLASLTKVLVTGLLCARRIASGEFSMETTLRELLGEDVPSDKAAISIGHLVSHTSGLPAWKPLYLLADSSQAVMQEIMRTDLEHDGSKVVYSDLNFILLSFLIEKLSGETIDQVADSEIIRPLGLSSTSFRPARDVRKGIAASELGNEFERQTCREQGYLNGLPEGKIRSAFRTYQIWGEVHDGNAYFMDGVAGHAGLFSTAEEVFRIALEFLPGRNTLLDPGICSVFRTNLTEGLNEDRSFAFQLASTKDSTAGSRMSLESFGHTGFTGTSLWIDPINDRVFVLLTNRTHARPLPFANINSVRRAFHDFAIDELEKKA